MCGDNGAADGTPPFPTPLKPVQLTIDTPNISIACPHTETQEETQQGTTN